MLFSLLHSDFFAKLFFSKSGPWFRTLCNSCTCRNLAYSEYWNIQHNSTIASRCIFRTLPTKIGKPCVTLDPGNIDNPRILRTLTYLKPTTYLEPSRRFKMECFAKTVQNYNYFSKVLYLRSLTGFWISPSLNRYPLICWINLCYGLYETSQNPNIFRNLSIIVNSDIFRHIHVLFRHIQPYYGIFRILCNSCVFRTLP